MMTPYPQKQRKPELKVPDETFSPSRLHSIVLPATICTTTAGSFVLLVIAMPVILESVQTALTVLAIIGFMITFFYVFALSGEDWYLKPLPEPEYKDGFWKEDAEVKQSIKKYTDLYSRRE